MKNLAEELGFDELKSFPENPEDFQITNCEDATKDYVEIKRILRNIRREIRRSRNDLQDLRIDIQNTQNLIERKEIRLDALNDEARMISERYIKCMDAANYYDDTNARYDYNDRQRFPPPPLGLCKRNYATSMKPVKREIQLVESGLVKSRNSLTELQETAQATETRLKDLRREQTTNQKLLDMLARWILDNCEPPFPWDYPDIP